MTMKLKYKLAFMDMAERFGQTSEAVRLKVGCLLVKNGHIIAEGVNGMPPEWPTEVCEDKEYAHEKYNHLMDGSQEVSLSTKTWLAELYPNGDKEGWYKLVTKPECRHSEVAALEKLWHSSETSDGAEAYISHSPCLPCSIKLKTAKISKVYYRHNYRSDEGVKYLLNNGVDVEQI